MTGDYTKVPLRASERWTGARMQQGRVLLDHEWNLNLDAASGSLQAATAAVIGAAGVPRRSSAFRVDLSGSDLLVRAGRMWIDGLMALAPADFTYSSQPGIAPLPTAAPRGRVLIYLDVFSEHVQPAEDASLLEPALSPVDSAARTRVGYRVRFRPTTALTCQAAWRDFAAVARSSGRLTVERVAGTGPTDPCAPPADDLSLLPDGLLRIEVLDPGTQATARFAWSYENGAAALPVVAPIAGQDVTVTSSPALRFSTGDLVEVSWLSRRADRIRHADGAGLYTVGPVVSVAAGDRLTLDRVIAAPPAGAEGLVVRRWDGEAVGAASGRMATLRGLDLVRFTAGPGDYEAGDWWGVRLRDAGQGVEALSGAEPDGTRHAFAPLALADLDAGTLEDCRPTFRSLVDVGEGTCTLTLRPGDDLQLALDDLPPGGGEICLRAGEYVLDRPLRFESRRRIVLHGAGPATVLRAAGSEMAVVFEDCDEVEVRALRAQGAVQSPRSPGDLDGALTFAGCTDVLVHDCTLTCADADRRAQACLTARPSDERAADRIRVERCRLEVGARQVGVLLVDTGVSRVSDNHVRLSLTTGGPPATGPRFVGQGIVVAGSRAETTQILDNLVESAVQGIHVGVSDASTPEREAAGEVVLLGNVIHLLVPVDYERDRHAVFVGNARSVHVKDTVASLTRIGAGAGTLVEAIRVFGQLGPFLVVRQTSLSGFRVGVSVRPLDPIPNPRVWLVAETMAAGGVLAVDAPSQVDSDEHNAPMPALPALAAVTLDAGSVGGGATISGQVQLTAPARTGGAIVTLSSSNTAAATVPASVTVPAGTQAASFAVSTRSVPADANVTVTAAFDGVTRTAALIVRAAATAAAVTLNPASLVGGLANSTGTVTLSADAPAGGAAVALSSVNPPIAGPSAAAVTVPAGQRSANFLVTTRSVPASIVVPISAAFGGVTRTAGLSVLPAPLLKVGAIRVFVFGGLVMDSAVNTDFLPLRRIDVETPGTAVSDVVIEVDFIGADLNPDSVTGASFRVEAGPRQPAAEQITVPEPNRVRWRAASLGLGTWTVRLAGNGATFIRSAQGRRLDGELTQFPSGDGAEGGDTTFAIRVLEEDLDLRDRFNVVDRNVRIVNP
jgi:hypothetical protein